MKISLNPTLFAQNQLQRTSKAIAKSLERLSSGDRVNRAADDSVTLARDSTMNAQVRGLRQGIQNANQAVGMLSTAESAIGTQLDIVVRMRELAVQASNGTLTSGDRTNLNTEMNQLFQEFQRLTNNTEFNGLKLLNGSIGKVGLQIGDKRESGLDQIFMDISNLDASLVFQKTIGTGVFYTRTTYDNANPLTSIATGDVNGDGKIDIVGADLTNGSLMVSLGNGDGTFQSATTVSINGGTGTVNVMLKDVNRDGKLDAISSNYLEGGAGGSISVQLGNGDGTFRTRISVATYAAAQPYKPVFDVGDVTGDGIVDIVATAPSSADIYYYAGRGDGTYSSGVTLVAGSGDYLDSVKLGDINNDGILDLEVSDSDLSDDLFYLGNGNGTVRAPQTVIVSTSSQGSFGDFNNDGKLDWIAGIATYLGNGDGTFGAANLTPGTVSSNEWIVGDVNNDGNLDAVSYSNGKVLMGNGDGTFVVRQTISILTTSVRDGALVDLNNDGVLDYINANAGGTSATNGFGVSLANTIQTSAISSIDITTQSKAQSLLKILDTAMNSLQSEQSRLGGLHERLDEAASTNLLRADSIEEARQNAKSTDLALETAELVRNQILQQAQVAVLAQANLQMQVVLQLLKPLQA